MNEHTSALNVARRARTRAREKMADHIGSPNLTFVGREKPVLSPTHQAPPKSAVTYKNDHGNGREKSVEEVER